MLYKMLSFGGECVMTSKIKYINLSDKVFDVMNYINLNVTLVDLNGQEEITE